ncbi:MAG TPA: hypothetical protein VGX03_02355 [Candidatus Binatia bacterium]|jgi:hypothetical protein|nr:hypothetical protein [Candidatus Binatia bacterium]
MANAETSGSAGGSMREEAHQTEKSAKTMEMRSIIEVISKIVAVVLGLFGLAETAAAPATAISIAITIIL